MLVTDKLEFKEISESECEQIDSETLDVISLIELNEGVS